MNKKKLILLIIAVLIVIAIPLTVFVAQQQQEIRQRAASLEKPSLFFTMKDNITPINKLSLVSNQSVAVSLYLNPEFKDINGFDISIQVSTPLTITQSKAGKGGEEFNEEIFNAINPQNNTLRFSRVSSKTDTSIIGSSGNLQLLDITLKVSSEGEGKIELLGADVASVTSTDFLKLAQPLPSIAFTIQAPAPTATPTATLAPTPIPGSALLALSVKIPGLGREAAENLPRTISRPVIVTVRTATKDIEKQGTLVFDKSDGLFKTDPKRPVDLGLAIPTNTPLDLVIKVGSFKGFVSNVSLSQGPNPAPPTPTLQVGLDDSGNVDAVSYFNALTGCFSGKSCTNKLGADLNDDGSVDGIDFNIFLKSIRTIISR